MFEGAYLDGKILFALINQAIKDDYVNIEKKKDYQEDFPTISTNCEIQKALDLLLIFNKLYLPIEIRYTDVFNFERLIKEDLIELSHRDFVDYTAPEKQGNLSDGLFYTLKHLRPFVRSRLFHFFDATGLFKQVNEAIKIVGLKPSYYYKKQIVEKFIMVLESGLNLSVLSKNSIPEIIMRYFLTEKTEVQFIDAIITDMFLGCFLFNQSSVNNIPIVSDMFNPRSIKKIESGPPIFNNDANKLIESFQLFKIVIYDLNGYKPIVNSIEDVLRLREDKRIQRFRKRLFQFVQCVTQGDSHNINDMRKGIIDASSALKKIEPYERVSKWTTYLSIPTSIFETFIGIPVIGISMGLIGGTSQAFIDYSKVKNDWVLFGQ